LKKIEGEMAYSLSKKSVLNIFIGSPGDVTEEREIAKSVVDRINNYVAINLDLVVELRGWEDTIPGYSRPQKLINEDVMRCDLFLGLMYKRWGSPSGKYTSGFEEEFAIAQKRMESGDLKDIWLFLRNISQDFLEDPTDQLLKVLDFRKKIQSEKKLLYKTYNNVMDWEKLLYDTLSFHITKEYLPTPEKGISTHSIPQTSHKTAGELGIVRRNEKVAVENTLNAVRDSFEKDKFQSLDDGIKANLYLLATSLLYDKSISSEMLNVHEVQFLFKNRTSIKPIALEKKLILRTILSDEYNLKCGWYWYTKSKIDIIKILKIFSQKDYSEGLRYQSMVYLYALKGFDSPSEFESSLHDTKKVVLMTVNIFETYGKKNEIKLIEPLQKNRSEEISEKTSIAIFAILLRSNIKDVIEYILHSNPSEKALNKAVLKYQELFLSKLTIGQAKRLMATGNNFLRSTIFERFYPNLSDEDLWLFTNDQSNTINSRAFLELLNRGVKITFEEVDKKFSITNDSQAIFNYLTMREKDKIYLEIYKKMSYEELEKSISWDSFKSPIIYRAMAEVYYTKFKKTLVDDLRTKFERIKKPFDLMRKLSPELEKSISEFDKYSDNIRDGFAFEAIGALTNNMVKNDLILARELINENYQYNDDSIKCNLLRIIEKFGNTKDIKILEKLSNSKSTSVRHKSIEIITALDKNNKFGLVEKLIHSDIKEEVRRGLRHSIDINYEIDESEIIKLLYHENDDIRLDSLSYLCKTNEVNVLEKVVEEYISKDGYYYNVVCWIDRLLYSPSVLNKYFYKQILERLEIQDQP
jgi:hypothetical protein